MQTFIEWWLKIEQVFRIWSFRLEVFTGALGIIVFIAYLVYLKTTDQFGEK